MGKESSHVCGLCRSWCSWQGLSPHSLNPEAPGVLPASFMFTQGLSESSGHRRMASLMEMSEAYHLKTIEGSPEVLNLEKRRL